MINILFQALKDSLSLLPFLFLIYVLIEIVEYKYSHKIRESVERAGKAGPAIGSLAGSVPQCGFSVLSTALYNSRLITIGTLMAVYVATSDEAIPILLSHPSSIRLVWPIIAVKIVLAIFWGYLIDLFFKTRTHKEAHPEDCIDELGCCGHQCDSDKLDVKKVFWHPLIHTLKIFGFILAINIVLNVVLFKVGESNLQHLILGKSIFAPVVTAFIGLIPNCAASVVIAQLYLKDIIGFGAAISGLSAGAGLGLILLFKENKNIKNSLLIVSLLLFASIVSGMLIQIFYK